MAQICFRLGFDKTKLTRICLDRIAGARVGHTQQRDAKPYFTCGFDDRFRHQVWIIVRLAIRRAM